MNINLKNVLFFASIFFFSSCGSNNIPSAKIKKIQPQENTSAKEMEMVCQSKSKNNRIESFQYPLFDGDEVDIFDPDEDWSFKMQRLNQKIILSFSYLKFNAGDVQRNYRYLFEVDSKIDSCFYSKIIIPDDGSLTLGSCAGGFLVDCHSVQK